MNQRLLLVDLYVDLLVLAREVRAGAFDACSAQELSERCEDLFQRVEAESPMVDVPMAHLQSAKYALCALFDEIVLARGGALAQAWSSAPLQLRFFNDFNAGDEFYNRLESMRHARDERQLQVLEVYHLCLCLGFAGRLNDRRGKERRRILIDNLATELSTSRRLPGPAAPDALRESVTLPWWQRLPPWYWLLAAFLIVIAVYALYHHLLASALAQSLASMEGR